jgi:adenylate cyclase
MSAKIERKLTTILSADAEGYSTRMEANEAATFDALKTAREIFAKFISRHNGRIANTAGDAIIAEFPSVVEAVACGIEVQQELSQDDSTPGGPLRFRIGIHLGDVIVDGDDLLGEGVNLAARLQTMADPGGILVSQQVYDQVENKLTVGFEYLGEKRPKNFAGDVSVYRVSSGAKPAKIRIAKRTDKKGQSPKATQETSADMRSELKRKAKLGGVVFAFLLAIDIATGPGSFAQFPGVVILVLLGFLAAPVFATNRFPQSYLRAAVVIGGLTLINLFTWSGSLWVIYPALVVGAIIAVRHFATPEK